jgi:hypothetical protein
MKEKENCAKHKKYKDIFFVLLIFQTITFAQNVQEAWVSRYNYGVSVHFNEVADIAVDDLGNVYVTGSSAVDQFITEYATVKYNASGVEQWVKRYKGPPNVQDLAHAIAVDNSSNVYVTGESTGSGTGQDYATIKYDSAGTEVWVARYNGPAFSTDVASDIAVDDSGNVYVTGGSQGSGTGQDYATIKYNASGVEQWVSRYNGNGLAGFDVASTIYVDDDGNVYVTGESQGIGTGRDYATVKYNASGTEMWVARYNGFGNYIDSAVDMAVDDSGNVYVAGYSSGPNGNFVTDYATIKYNSSGTELWVKRYNGPGDAEDFCTSLAIDGAGNVFVTGFVTAGVELYPIATVKYSTTGTEEWVALYNGVFSAELGEDIATDTSGNVYVTGYTSVVQYSFNDYVTIKYSNSGIEEWVIKYDHPQNLSDQAKAIAVDVNGNVYVTGFSFGDYCTIKYVQGSATFQLSVDVSDGWNMVSIPGLHPTDQNVNTWWQDRDLGADVFKYLGGYQSVTDAVPGIGYWMKHAGALTYNTGEEWPAGGIQTVAHDPLAGASGWNLIGGYELSVTAANVTTNPPGLQSGPIYKYSGGYAVATTLDPGDGYWIKLDAAGQIIIPETMAKGEAVEYFPEDWGRIILTDATGINYTLYAVKGEVNLDDYELPPAPPAGMFDIRYSSGRIAEDINSAVKTIDMSGVTYPLTVRVEGMDIRLMDETGKTINANLKKGEDIVISDATIQKLMVSGELIPAEYALAQNYPNPFNPSTTINFNLAVDSKVSLKIFNVLGQEVAILINGQMAAGNQKVSFDASSLSSDVYFYRIDADGVDGQKFSSAKKMILIK